MRRPRPFVLSSWALALVLTLTTLVGGAAAGSTTYPASGRGVVPAAIAVGTLCVVKFNDIDGDGNQGPNEPALTGWVFGIKDGNGNPVGTIGTAPPLGRCIDLPPGTYTVAETPQQGWTPTTPGGGTQTVTVVAGQTTTVTFGNQQHGRLCIVKFNDLNGDGVQQATEPVLANWTFNISKPPFQWFAPGIGLVVAIGITTGPNGSVCQDLLPGTYKIEEVPQSGWVQTAPVPVGPQNATITAGQTTTVTFGNHQNLEPGRLCVQKFNDLNGNGVQDPGEPFLTGWVFTIKDALGNVVGTITTVAGALTCINLPPGTYTVTETPQPGWTPTTPGGLTQTAVVVAGQTTTVIFGNKRCCLTFTFLGGKIDNFSLANGATAEPVTPVTPALTPPIAAYFDATTSNVRFGHRFYLGAGNCIESATLQIKIKALQLPPSGSNNDTLTIKVPGGPSWTKSIGTLLTLPLGPPLTTPWAPPKVKTLLFNLGVMPSAPTDLIPALNSIRMLDIIIQDDTKVDYIKLIVVFCECKTHSIPTT